MGQDKEGDPLGGARLEGKAVAGEKHPNPPSCPHLLFRGVRIFLLLFLYVLSEEAQSRSPKHGKANKSCHSQGTEACDFISARSDSLWPWERCRKLFWAQDPMQCQERPVPLGKS
jgi:hypothetical protein